MASGKKSKSGRKPVRAEMVDVPSARLRAARSLWSQGAHNDAIALFTETMRLEPDNVQSYIVAARAYAEKYQFERMDATLDKLVSRAPRHPGIHHYIGETFASLKLPERAIESYELAASLPGAGPPTWLELASLYERNHRLDEAKEYIDRALHSGFDHPMVAMIQGRVERRLKHHDQAERCFLTVVARTGEDSNLGCQAWGEIAELRDQVGDYSGAIDAIEHCKRVQRAHQEPFWSISNTVQERVGEMVRSLSREDFRMWRTNAAPNANMRTALLTGFPRSGTTLLEQVLDAHPDLVSSEERDFVGTELYHALTYRNGNLPLATTLRELSDTVIAQQRQKYISAMEYLLGEPIADRMHLDKNPAYNVTIPFLLRILPETRLIVALRDPRDVVLSCYLRYLPLNTVSVQFLDPLRTAKRYAFDMSAWLHFRDLVDEPWCEVRYEDMVADIATQTRRVLETLKLEWNDAVLSYRERLIESGKHVTSPTYEAVAQPIYTRSIGRWKSYAAILEPAFETLAPLIREFGYDV